MIRPRRFTGRHMLVTMLLFFGVIIAVNMTMAVLATRTFGGTVVDNSYVASQRFNAWLDEARAQERLGWKVAAEVVDRRVVIDTGSLAGASVTVTARHPLGRAADIAIAFTETDAGRHVARTRLPAGRWRLHIAVVHGRDRADYVREATA